MKYSIVELSKIIDQTSNRLDAEYWHPEAIMAVEKFPRSIPLGNFITKGYRVVYENTKILFPDAEQAQNFPRFLQASDIDSNGFINFNETGYVSNDDWIRYKKGHIQEGEVLIEVKGNVKKVAVVSKDLYPKTLVSGTLYKCQIANIDKYYLCVFLTSKYGHILKNRLLSNIATPFINKNDLYNIPIPIFESLENIISRIYLKATDVFNRAFYLYKQANNLLLSELNLSDWKPKHKLSFVKSYSDTQNASRIDAEYFQPTYEEIEKTIIGYSGGYSFIKDEFRHIKSTFKIENQREYNYVEIGGINVSTGEIIPLKLKGSELPANAKRVLKKGDIIISKVRTYRGAITIVEKDGYVGSGAFTVLQEKGQINKETLFTFLHSKPLLAWSLKPNTGTSYPVIIDDDILNLPIPLIPETIQKKIAESVNESFRDRELSKQLLDIAKRGVEMAIEEDEAQAKRWIDNELNLLKIDI